MNIWAQAMVGYISWTLWTLDITSSALVGTLYIHPTQFHLPIHSFTMDYSCFNGQVAVITGAGGEIGGGTALEMASHGASLALVDIHEERLNETVGKLREKGVPDDRILAKLGDVTKADQVKGFISDVVAKFGDKIHILVNIVGAKRIKVSSSKHTQFAIICNSQSEKLILVLSHIISLHNS